jgi:mono/diheme cytochrome c family protein
MITSYRLPAALALLTLLAGCERPKSGAPATAGAPDTGVSGSVPAPDTAPAPAADTQAAPAPVPAAAAPAETAKAPVKPAAPAPAAPAPKPTAAPKQDTGTTQTAEAPLRDIYHPAPRDTVDQATYDGWKQYNLNCARCHGEDVLGTTIAPHLILSLKPDGAINTKELFIQTVCAGRPEKGMPAWCALGMDMNQINDIYAYVKGRSEAKLSPGRPALKPEG